MTYGLTLHQYVNESLSPLHLIAVNLTSTAPITTHLGTLMLCSHTIKLLKSSPNLRKRFMSNICCWGKSYQNTGQNMLPCVAHQSRGFPKLPKTMNSPLIPQESGWQVEVEEGIRWHSGQWLCNWQLLLGWDWCWLIFGDGSKWSPAKWMV